MPMGKKDRCRASRSGQYGEVEGLAAKEPPSPLAPAAQKPRPISGGRKAPALSDWLSSQQAERRT